MKKLVIILGFLIIGLSSKAQTNESRPLYSPIMVKIEMEKAGMKLSNDQFIKLQKAHQLYVVKIGEANTSGKMSDASQLNKEYSTELAGILSEGQMEKYNKMQREGISRKTD